MTQEERKPPQFLQGGPAQSSWQTNVGGIGGAGANPDPFRQVLQLKAGGQIEQARQLCERIVAQNPDHAHAWVALGECTVMLGQREEGIRLAERGITGKREYPGLLAIYADLLCGAARCDESLEYARKAAQLAPTLARAHCLVARNLEQMQRIDEAIQYLQTTIEKGYGSASVRTVLGRLFVRIKDYEAALREIEVALNDSTLHPNVRPSALYEKGMVLDRLGEFDQAFESFAQAGQAAAALPGSRRFDPQLRLQTIEDYRTNLTADVLRLWHESPQAFDDRGAPTFLVGFPRSGTTMTEQILAAHPDVETTGERLFFSQVREAFGRMFGLSTDITPALKQLSEDHIRQLRRMYWNAVAACKQINLDAPVIVDKLPLNLMHLGLIDIIFPEAKIIVALRDPRDVCLSCFFQDFRLNQAMIHFVSLDGTARFYDAVMGLYLHLRDLVGLETIEVRYEDTVADLEHEGRRIVSHLGLEWSDDLMQFHERARERYITTPSAAAVTEPIHKRAVARWKNYEKHLETVMPDLQPYIDAFGYGTGTTGGR